MSNVKVLRGQMRQIVSELLTEEFKAQLVKAVYSEMLDLYKKDFTAMNEVVSKRMDALEKRHNDIINMIMRELGNNKPVMPALERQS